MTIYEPGTILKRQFADFQEVEVVSADKEYTTIKDSSGLHFVPTSSMSTHFFVVNRQDKENQCH